MTADEKEKCDRVCFVHYKIYKWLKLNAYVYTYASMRLSKRLNIFKGLRFDTNNVERPATHDMWRHRDCFRNFRNSILILIIFFQFSIFINRNQHRFDLVSVRQREWIVYDAHFAIHFVVERIVCQNRPNRINGNRTPRQCVRQLVHFPSNI